MTKKLADGITVNSASEINGAEWVKKIRKCTYIPDWFKKQIQLKGNSITTPIKYTFPGDVIQKAWWKDFFSAFLGGWETSTMHVEIKVETQSESIKRQQENANDKRERLIFVSHHAHLSKVDKISGIFSRTHKYSKLKSAGKFRPQAHGVPGDAFSYGAGETVEVGEMRGRKTLLSGVALNSKRGLLAIATRVNVRHGSKTQRFNVTDDELVHTLFHEIVCHAGRINQGLKSEHGNITVTTRANQIDQLIPTGKTSKKVLGVVERLFKTTKKESQRASLGFDNAPTIDSGTLARTKMRSPGAWET